MKGFYALEGVLKSYDWGDGACLPRMLGLPYDEGRPYAEWWLGAHPAGVARAREAFAADGAAAGGSVPLDALIDSDPAFFAGPGAPDRRLPFLFKALAVKKSLSLQVHPSLAEARAGFERENARGVPLDARERGYKDANHKPEIVRALSPFRALCGLRPRADIRRRLAALDVRPFDCLMPLLADGADEAAGYRALFSRLFDMPQAARETVSARLLDGDAGIAGGYSGDREAWERCAALAASTPGDAAVIAPLFLNTVELAAGEAFFVPPGVPHAYLDGMAVELMAASDNVLRGGLTSKHIDAAEFLRVLRAEPFAPAVRRAPPETAAGILYDYPCGAPFSLAVVEDARDTPLDGGGPLLAVPLGGEVRFTLPGRDGAAALAPGTALFVAAGAPRSGLRASGRGPLFVAGTRP